MGPDWKLDRRDSGRLFWRRDSGSSLGAATPTKERVKFRYDVEVLEFWETDDGEPAERVVDRRDALRASKSPKPAPPFILCVACVAAIAVMVCYQWIVNR